MLGQSYTVTASKIEEKDYIIYIYVEQSAQCMATDI